MKTLYLSTLLLLFFTAHMPGQTSRNCGTMPYLEAQMAEDPGLRERMEQIEREIGQWSRNSATERTQAVITIPVVFHVVYNSNNAATQNISDTRILAQLDVLNKDFARLNADAINTPGVFQGASANTNIQFCMAQRDPNGNATNGIVRVATNTNSFNTNNNVKFTSSGGSNAWPAGSYLNIWVCNLSNGLLGYAQFPGGSASTDGVVVLYSSVGSALVPGTAVPYHIGRTATHEVGHWLNLRHIWGDASCGNDQVTDTPTQQTANYGCPSFPHVTCSNGPNGDMYMNYMDYTDDGCMNMFTTGQATRMTATLNGTRSSLLTSSGCLPPGGSTCGTPASLNATSITSGEATLGWSIVTGATSYNLQYKPTSASTWTTTTSLTTSKTITGLSSSTSYAFQVQAVCGTVNGAYSTPGTFTTAATGSCTDIYEPNNTSSASIVIPVNTDINALIAFSTDVDWYQFTTASPNTNLQLTLTNLPADYDVQLYRSNLRRLATSQKNGTTPEVINYNSSSATTYYVKVYGFHGASNGSQCYKLHINASSSQFRIEENMSNASKDDLINELVALPNPSSTQTTFEFLSDIAGSSSVTILDMTGRKVYAGTYEVLEGVNRFELDVSKMSNGMYLILLDQPGDLRKGRFIKQE